MERLNGKVAVVTGGGSGIGRAIAERFAKEGAHVVIAGRKEQPLQETAAADGKISYVVGDITKTETIEEIVRTVQDKFGRLDILVNNAGWCPVQPITEITIEDYDRAFGLDVRAVVDMTVHALPLILQSKGTILNLSSTGATHPAANLSMYVGAKAAIENFTRAWAIELAPKGSAPGGGEGPRGRHRRGHSHGTVRPAGGSGQCGPLPGVRRGQLCQRLCVRHHRRLKYTDQNGSIRIGGSLS